jgi:AcrR family transcriptional regulator
MLMAAERYVVGDGGIRARRERDAAARSAGQAQLAQIQRARILAGMFGAACELGAANVTVADVVARSGVSRRTFYETFEDRDDCFLAAFEDALATAAARVVPAYQAQSKWVDRIRAGLSALARFLEEEPRLGRVLVCESLSAGRRALACRGAVIAQLVAIVEEGRDDGKNAEALPELTGEGTVGAVVSILHNNLEGDKAAPLSALVNNLMAMIVLPYLGFAAARRELARPVQPPASDRIGGGGVLVDLFKGSGMRLTYRTIRVLMTVAELDEQGVRPSNRELGDLADIRDQGQISKLLHRLQRAGLIDNGGAAPGQGAPNAWRPTPEGERLARSIRTHTANPDAGVSER